MSLSGLDRLLATAPSFERALEAAGESVDFAAAEPLRPALIAGLLRRRMQAGSRGAYLLIAATSREADAMRSAVASLVPEAITAEFPAWETLPHERLSPSAETVGRRAAALRLLREAGAAEADPTRPFVLVASVRAALQPVSPHAANAEPVVLRAGSDSEGLERIAAKLVETAYTRVDMVTRRGEFAVRGGILDVFPPTADQAVRVDFFGDEVDQIRRFAVSDQRSAGDPLPMIELWPARELLLTDDVRERAAALLPRFPARPGTRPSATLPPSTIRWPPSSMPAQSCATTRPSTVSGLRSPLNGKQPSSVSWDGT